jgi:hypothetical protein
MPDWPITRLFELYLQTEIRQTGPSGFGHTLTGSSSYLLFPQPKYGWVFGLFDLESV